MEAEIVSHHEQIVSCMPAAASRTEATCASASVERAMVGGCVIACGADLRQLT